MQGAAQASHAPSYEKVHPLHGILQLMDSPDFQQHSTGLTALQCLLQDQPEALLDAAKGEQLSMSSLVGHLVQALEQPERAVQAAALWCLRAMTDSQACLHAMSSAGPHLLEHVAFHIGRAILTDIINAAWIMTAIQRHHVNDSCISSSCLRTSWSSLLQKSPGSVAAGVPWAEAAEQECVAQLVQLLKDTIRNTAASKACQAQSEAACGLYQLIWHRRTASGPQAAGKLQSAAAQQGGLQILVQLLSSQAPLQLHAVSALTCLVWNHYANQAALVSQGSLRGLIAICLAACPEAAASAAACLGNLLHAWPGRPMALETKAALQPLAEALDLPSLELQARAAKALQLISC